MNHFYRLVWSEAKSAWVAVSENARSRKKGGGRSAQKAVLATMLVSGMGMGLSQAQAGNATTVVPTGGQTNAYISANGVPVVNINAANAAGLSHNNYTRYDVEANGLVLNNGNTSQLTRQSQLAGQIAANLNLINEASVILNEVVSTNRSTLAGYTEVLGGRADVIVANPNGITCNGCGFINTNRATLTTGTSNIGSDGSLNGFTVNRGDVLIEGAGIKSAQEVFDLVARSVKVDADIVINPTGSLGITAGNNTWDYSDRNVSATAEATGNAATYAIDSSALGGMYAGRIRLIATEAGVGVRMLGDAAASADDFTLSSAGKIEIQSAVQAQRDVNIATTSGTSTDDIFLNDSSVSANRNLKLSAVNGEIQLTNGTLYAENKLEVNASILSDVATSATRNTRYAGGNNTFNATYITPNCGGDESQVCDSIYSVNIDGSVWGAGAALSGDFESLTIGSNGATLYAGSTMDLTARGSINFATATVTSVGDMTLTSDGSISTSAGSSQGIHSTAGDLALTSSRLSNAGILSADVGSLTARVDYGIYNTGTLHAGTTLDIAALSNFWSAAINNYGSMIADGDFVAQAYSFNNRAGANIRATSGTTLTANSLINDGTFIASDTDGQTSTFTLASLENNSTLQAKGSLEFNLTDTLENTGDLLATNNLSINANTSALDISNTSTGSIQAGGALSITGSNATFDTQEGIVVGNTTDIAVKSLRNNGRLQSTSDMTISIDDASRAYSINDYTFNSGVVHSGGNLNWTTTSNLRNLAGASISALGTLSFSSEIFYNDGTLYAGGLNGTAGGLEATMGNLFYNTVSGEIYSSYDITIDARQFRNNNLVSALNDITITSSFFLNELYGGIPNLQLDYSTSDTVKTKPQDMFEPGCDTACDPHRVILYQDTITTEQEEWQQSVKPQILAGNDMTIDVQSGTGRNTLALLSAANILTLKGTEGSSFINQSFSRISEQSIRYWFIDKRDSYLWADPEWYYGFLTNVDPETFEVPTVDGGGIVYGAGATYNYLQGLPIGSPFNFARYTDTFSSTLSNEARDQAEFYDAGMGSELTTYSSNIKAGTITGNLGDLSNITNLTQGGATREQGVSDTATEASDDDKGVAVDSTSLNNGGISFNSLGVTLPVSPNGFFVPNQNINTNYLIETNPLFNVGSNFVGSNYMLDNFGYNPEDSLRRLGDSNYEAYLIRQQLIEQTGINILEGYGTEADQMKTLMDQAYEESQLAGNSGEGFEFGQALTPAQIASLGKDMVWMVETVVQGERVLTPVVYLAPATRNEINVGAVIGGENIHLNVAMLTNTGGTISGSETLTVISAGDITNTSGKISGGDVDLTSTQGSIINQTQVEGHGNSVSYSTDIGKTATIESTGTMNLDANKDIKVIGANVTAEGDANITAGGSITVDTIVDKTITTTGTSSEGSDSTSSTNTHTETETNIGSGITIGGNATMTAEDEITVRGSDVTIDGNADVEGKNGINIVDAVDKKRTTTITESTSTFGSDSDSEADSASHSDSDSSTASAYAKAQAEAEASAEAEGTADFKIQESVRTVTTSGSDSSAGSNFKVGGKLTATTEGTLKIQGSDVESGGDMELNVKDIEVLSGQDHEWSETTTTRSSIGIYAEGDAEAKAGAEAGSNAGTSGLGADASAKAEASAEASGTVTFGAQTETENSTHDKVSNRGSSLKSGSGLTINATGDAKFVGADVESAGDISINAENIINEAAKDTESNTYSKTTETAGIYIDASVGAEASSGATANAGIGNNASGSVEGSVEAEVGAGLRYNTKSESSTEDSLTHVGNTFKSGGNFSRIATDTIVDQGTEIEAGGNFNQEARVIKDEAIHDVKTTTSESSEHDVKVGVYAGGSAEASAEADASVVGRTDKGTGKDAEAGAGFSAKYKYEEASAASEDKTAVTSKFKAGGNINSKSTEETSLVGAQFESGGDTTIEAKSLNYQAAQDSSTSSSSSNEVGVEGKVSVYGSPGAKLDAEYEHGNKSSESTTAKAGSINAGGNLTIKTTGDTTLVGTSLEAGNKASIDAGGNVDFKAAKNTSSSTDASVDVSASLSATKSNKGMEGGAEGEYTGEWSNTAVVGSIKSGAGGISISSGKDTTLTGTQLDSSGTTSIDAGGNVKLNAAESSTSSNTLGGSIDAMKHEKGPGLYQGGEGEGGAALSGNYSKKVESITTSINSAGGVTIEAAVIENQEAKLSSDNGAVTLSGAVLNTEARKSDISIGDSLEYKTDASTGD